MPLVEEPPVFFRNSLIYGETIINKDQSVAGGPQKIPTWNTAGRPQNARKGTIGFKFQTNNLEFWNGTAWLTLRMKKI